MISPVSSGYPCVTTPDILFDSLKVTSKNSLTIAFFAIQAPIVDYGAPLVVEPIIIFSGVGVEYWSLDDDA